MAHTKDDALRRAFKEAQVEAQRRIEAVQSALKSSWICCRLQFNWRKSKAAITHLQISAIGENRRRIGMAMDDLEVETKDFAAGQLGQIDPAGLSREKNIDDIESHVGSAKDVGEHA